LVSIIKKCYCTKSEKQRSTKLVNTTVLLGERRFTEKFPEENSPYIALLWYLIKTNRLHLFDIKAFAIQPYSKNACAKASPGNIVVSEN
jgi:hypothetical protein